MSELFSVLVGFLLLLAVTSSTYIINDLSDLEADRAHPTKSKRPIASGLISIRQAATVACITIPVAIGLGFALNPWFGMGLTSYLIITLCYSFGLKRIPVFDVFVIAVLFTTRLLMGSVLLPLPLSEWLITFSMFFFFSLAMAKRHAEIVKAQEIGSGILKGRGYELEDAPLTLAAGVAASVGSIIIMVLYLVEEGFRSVNYDHAGFLWAIVLALAVWMGRIWLLTHRGRMIDDPVSFALRDKVSLVLGGFVALAFGLAL